MSKFYGFQLHSRGDHGVSRKRCGAAHKDSRPVDRGCGASVAQGKSSRLGEPPPHVAGLDAVIVIEEQDDARKDGTANEGQEARSQEIPPRYFRQKLPDWYEISRKAKIGF